MIKYERLRQSDFAMGACRPHVSMILGLVIAGFGSEPVMSVLCTHAYRTRLHTLQQHLLNFSQKHETAASDDFQRSTCTQVTTCAGLQYVV